MAKAVSGRNVDTEGTNPSMQTTSLFINIEEVLKCQGVEKQRLEFKKSWNVGPTKFQVIKTVTAFANDYYNDNGGYIVIGVEEDESEDATSQIKLPPVGVEARNLDKMQKEIMGACKGNIRPEYCPILSPEMVDGKHVLVIWAQASNSRPHTARAGEKGEHCYFIRKEVETVKANDEEIKEMLRCSAKIPFDDQMAKHESGIIVGPTAIRKDLVMKYLDDIRSKLDRKAKRRIIQKNLNLVVEFGEEKSSDGSMQSRHVPKNVALLMFNLQPEYYFRGAHIEITQYSRDKEVLHEWFIKGPLDKQIKECIDLVLCTTNAEKSCSSLTYPKLALREAIVNAVYHRGYEPEYNSPIKISIASHRLEICSYPGPHPSLKPEHFTSSNAKDIPLTPARNRRISEFLKDLKFAEARGTGVHTIFKTMRKNNKPVPQFEFDSSYFRVILPAHPKFQARMLLGEVEELEAKGEISQTIKLLQEAFDEDRSIINESLMMKFISLHDGRSDHPDVQTFKEHISKTTRKRSSLLKELGTWLHDKPQDNISQGVHLIQELVKAEASAKDLGKVTKLAITLYNECDLDSRKPVLLSNQKAHQLFEAYGKDLLSSDSTVAWHYACIKYNIYVLYKEKVRRESTGSPHKSLLSYLTEAKSYVDYVIFVSEKEEQPAHFIATQYRQLGYVLFYLSQDGKATTSDYKECYNKALQLDPTIRINFLMNPVERGWYVSPPRRSPRAALSSFLIAHCMRVCRH